MLIKKAKQVPIRQICDRFLGGGTVRGNEYVALNPRRADNHAGSFCINLTTGAWADFAINEKGGDGIDLVAYINNCSISDAAHLICDAFRIESAAPTEELLSLPKDIIAPLYDPLCDAAIDLETNIILEVIKQDKTLKEYTPNNRFIYRDENGFVKGAVIRIDSRKGKIIMPLSYINNQWHAKSFGKLIYGAELIPITTGPLLVVEGEKACDMANRMLMLAGSDVRAISWCGGANSVDKPNWACLRGREVILQPDNDEPGFKAMRTLGRIIEPIVFSLKVSLFPNFYPKSFDAADYMQDIQKTKAASYKNFSHMLTKTKSFNEWEE